VPDRNPSFFGPVLPQTEDAPDAFSFDELQRIRGRRIEADLLRTSGAAWPLERRFQTMYPCSLPPRTLASSGSKAPTVGC
jgi:hypothetical protein